MTGNTVESLLKDIIDNFEGNENFKVEFVSDNSFYIERKDKQETGEEIELITPGTASFVPAYFSGFQDGAVLIIEELKPGKAIGLWIKRSINKIKPCEKKGCTDLSCNTDTKENLEVVFSFDD